MLAALPARGEFGRFPLQRDPTFGQNGVSRALLPSAFSPHQMFVAADGRIYSLTATPGVGQSGDSAYHITRRQPGGALDLSYAAGGTLTHEDSTVAGDQAYHGLCVDGASGALYLVGATAGAEAFVVRRFLANGDVDTAWDSDGLASLPLPGQPVPVAQGCTVQADGKLVVVGSRSVPDADALGLRNGAFVARLTETATLDTGFGNAGVRVFAPVQFEAVQFSHGLRRVEVAGDGALYAAGESIDPRFALARDLLFAKLTPDGQMAEQFAGASLDPLSAAAGSGAGVVPLGVLDEQVAALSLNAGSSMVVAMLRDTSSGQPAFGVTTLRFTSRGAVDPSYGCAGFKLGDAQFAPTVVSAAAFDPDGRALFLGRDPQVPDEERLIRTSGLPELAAGGGDGTAIGDGCPPWRGERNLGGGGLPAGLLAVFGLAAALRSLRRR